MTTEQQPSPIEIAKALRQVKGVTDDRQYGEVLQAIAGRQAKTVTHAVAGLTEEDEFILMCVLMGTATHLAPLEQKVSIGMGLKAPDLVARFQPGFSTRGILLSRHTGYKCFVEVKSTKKDKFHMHGNALKKLRQFADAFGLPLVFAVRFLMLPDAALWVMVEDADRNTRRMTIGVSDWVSGLRPVLWDDFSFMLVPGTYFEATYAPNAGGVRHPQYGGQTEFQVIAQERRFAFSGDEAMFVSAFFEPYGLNEKNARREGNLTHVTYHAQNLALSLPDIIYRMNRLPRDSSGNLVYDATRTLRALADGQTPVLIGRGSVEQLGRTFCKIGVLAVLGHGDPEGCYRRWIATGGIQ